MREIKFKSGRGGLRSNSSALSSYKKPSNQVCDWCSKEFISVNKRHRSGRRFCSQSCKMKQYNFARHMKYRAHLTEKNRKGSWFKDPLHRLRGL